MHAVFLCLGLVAVLVGVVLVTVGVVVMLVLMLMVMLLLLLFLLLLLLLMCLRNNSSLHGQLDGRGLIAAFWGVAYGWRSIRV